MTSPHSRLCGSGSQPRSQMKGEPKHSRPARPGRSLSTATCRLHAAPPPRVGSHGWRLTPDQDGEILAARQKNGPASAKRGSPEPWPVDAGAWEVTGLGLLGDRGAARVSRPVKATRTGEAREGTDYVRPACCTAALGPIPASRLPHRGHRGAARSLRARWRQECRAARGATADRRVLGPDRDDPQQSAPGHEQQGPGAIRTPAAHQSRRGPEPVRRPAGPAPRRPRDRLRRAVQRPSAGARRRRAVRAARWLPRCRGRLPPRAPGAG